MAFKWGDMESGVFISVVNICRAVATALVLPLLIRLLGRPKPVVARTRGADAPQQRLEGLDLTLLRIAIILDVAGYLGYGLAPNGVFFLLAGVLTSFGAVGLAVSESTMTKLVPPERTGELMGVLSFLRALARVVVPPLVNLVYAWVLPRATFLGIAVFLCLAVSLSVFLRPITDGNGED